MKEYTGKDKIRIEKVKKAHALFMEKVNQGKHLAESMIEWAGDGFHTVTKEIYDYRLSICRKCEFWQEDAMLGYGRCLKCGCGKGKHKLPHEKCPIGLWGAVEPKLIDKNK